MMSRLSSINQMRSCHLLITTESLYLTHVSDALFYTCCTTDFVLNPPTESLSFISFSVRVNHYSLCRVTTKRVGLRKRQRYFALSPSEQIVTDYHHEVHLEVMTERHASFRISQRDIQMSASHPNVTAILRSNRSTVTRYRRRSSGGALRSLHKS